MQPSSYHNIVSCLMQISRCISKTILLVSLFTGTPKHIDYEDLKENLMKVEGVRRAHSLYVWSLTLNRTALSAHLVLGADILI